MVVTTRSKTQSIRAKSSTHYHDIVDRRAGAGEQRERGRACPSGRPASASATAGVRPAPRRRHRSTVSWLMCRQVGSYNRPGAESTVALPMDVCVTKRFPARGGVMLTRSCGLLRAWAHQVLTACCTRCFVLQRVADARIAEEPQAGVLEAGLSAATQATQVRCS